MKALNHPTWMVIAILTLLGAAASGAVAQPLDDELNPEGFAGIGAVVNAGEGGGATIAAVVPGGPAERIGVEPGDRILAVDGVSVEGMELADIVKRIRGKEGETVTLTLKREGRDEPLTFEIKRERIGFGGGFEFDFPGGPAARQDTPRRFLPWDGTFGYAHPGPAEQPVMVVDGGYIYILRGNVLYKVDTQTLKQVRATVLEPPEPER